MLLLILVLTGSTLVASQPGIPTLYAEERFTRAYISGANLGREFTQYEIVGIDDPPKISGVTVQLSSIAVISSDFCRTFVNMRTLHAEYASIEIILPGAFDECWDLQWLYLQGNLIKELPPNLFQYNRRIDGFWFDRNQLSTLPAGLFKGELPYFKSIGLRHNNFTEFPLSAFENINWLLQIHISSNELTDLPVESISEEFHRLVLFYYSDNLIPCSKIGDIKRKFRGYGIDSPPEILDEPKKRQESMGTEEGLVCLED